MNTENFEPDYAWLSSLYKEYDWKVSGYKFGAVFKVAFKNSSYIKTISLFRIVTNDFIINSGASESTFSKWIVASLWYKTGINCLLQDAPVYASGGPITMTVDKPKSIARINGVSVETISNRLPGAEQKVVYPCSCVNDGIPLSLNSVIIHLNDRHYWTREAIADWLDKEHDAGNIDIEFGSEPIKTKSTNLSTVSEPLHPGGKL